MFRHKTAKTFSFREYSFDKDSLGLKSFNHCSSINSFNNIQTLAWYGGKECDDTQSVYIVNPALRVHQQEPFTKVGGKTGNPIVFEHRGSIYMIYSKFESNRRGALRWQDCSLWLALLNVHKKKHPTIVDQVQIADHSLHLLARCNTIKMGTNTIIPLYNEKTAQNVIMVASEDDLLNNIPKITCTYGSGCIQHTVFRNGESLLSLSRNFRAYDDVERLAEFRQRKKRYSPLWNLTGLELLNDIGEVDIRKASTPNSFYFSDSKLYNYNSSVHAVDWDGEIFILWNRLATTIRSNMSLGRAAFYYDGICPTPLMKIHDVVDLTFNKRGSYPSMCVDKGKLYFTYTDDNYNISYNVWNKRQFRHEVRRRTVS